MSFLPQKDLSRLRSTCRGMRHAALVQHLTVLQGVPKVVIHDPSRLFPNILSVTRKEETGLPIGFLRPLREFNNLHTLNLAGCEMGNAMFLVLTSLFKHFSSLKDLDIGRNTITSAIFSGKNPEKIFIEFSRLTKLESLTLNGNNIGPSGVYSLSYALPFLPNLKSLELEEIYPMKDLQDIDPSQASVLKKNHFQAFSQLAKGISCAHNLETLSIAGNYLSAKTGCVLLEILSENCPRLKSLDLSTNCLADSVKLLGEEKKFPALAELDISDNKLSMGTAVEFVRDLLRHHSDNITSLGLSALIRKAPKHVSALIPILLEFPNLKVFLLDDMAMGNEGLAKLLLQPEKLSKVEKLTLGHNKISAAGIESLYGASKNLSALENLRLDDNEFSVQHIKKLMEIFQNLPSLKQLSLAYNDLNNDAFDVLIGKLAALPQLTCLELTGNKATARGLIKIIEALHDTEIVPNLNFLALHEKDDGLVLSIADRDLLKPLLRNIQKLRPNLELEGIEELLSEAREDLEDDDSEGEAGEAPESDDSEEEEDLE